MKQPMDGMVISNTYRAAAAGLSKSLANELGPQVSPRTSWTAAD